MQVKESKLNYLLKAFRQGKVQDEYLGILMPFYDADCDIGVYGFVGNNGIKIVICKKIENSIQETSSEIKLKQV
jgi:hypothetical protein